MPLKDPSPSASAPNILVQHSRFPFVRGIAHYLRPYRLQVLLLWLALLGTIATQLVNPQIIRRFLDAAQAGSGLQVLLNAAAIFLAIALVEQLLRLATTYLATNISWQATNNLREDVVAHCLTLDHTFYKTHSPGELIERIDGDINALGNLFSQLALNLINNLLLLAGVLFLLWWTDWRIGLVITTIASGGLLVVEWVCRKAIPYWKQAQQADAALYGFLEERLQGTEDLRANGAVAYTMRRLSEQLRHSYRAFIAVRPYNVGALMVPIFVFGLAYMATFLFGEWFYRRQGMTIGTVYLVIHYVGILSGPLWQIVNEIQDLQTAGASVARVQALLRAESSIQATNAGEKRYGRASAAVTSTVDNAPHPTLTPGPLALHFDEVSVRYAEDEAFALRDITFTLTPGEVLGLLGRTGSGKSTLTRLLLRLVEPTKGTIRLGTDRVDIRQLPLRTVRNHIGMVTQEVQLFHATVRENITLFDDNVADAALWSTAAALGLGEWLNALPAGLDTPLRSGGQGLSAGEAQLVAFLRIGLQDPSLIIFDEPSSRLDPLTERLLHNAMMRLVTGRTGIIIAHRLETVAQVDKIMVLAEGKMVEWGSREELLADETSQFARIIATSLVTIQPPNCGLEDN